MTIAKRTKAEVAAGAKVAQKERCYQGQDPAPCRRCRMESHTAEIAEPEIGVAIAHIAAVEGVAQIAGAEYAAAEDDAAIVVGTGGGAGVSGEVGVGHRGRYAPLG